ncbi:hypothetical protein M0805_009231 [Coniferiporia weirii]|nr:hypothetical protein M0805_009231 [Coniferiporia weirii]
MNLPVTVEGEGRNRRGSEGNGPSKGKRTVVSKYTRHACTQCRKARTKCEGGEPICERCRKTGHDCIWTQEDARRPLTRAHERALNHQNALLRAEVDRLKREVATLRMHVASTPSQPNDVYLPGPELEKSSNVPSDLARDVRPGGPLSPPNAPGPEEDRVSGVQRPQDNRENDISGLGTGLWGLVPLEEIGHHVEENGDLVLQDEIASECSDDGQEADRDCDVESAYDSDDESDDSDDDVDKALAAPTKTFFSEREDLHLYGFTSVFRLRQRGSQHTLRKRFRRPDGAGSGYDSYSSSQDQSASQLRQKQSGPTQARFKRDRKGKSKPELVTPSTALLEKTHVLLLGNAADSTWKGCDCQSDCWNRWLPKGIPLSRKEHDVLLDRLFIFFSSWCMRIIPEYFLRDMHVFLHPSTSITDSSLSSRSSSSALPKLAHYSPFLHNILLAVAAAFSTDPVIRKAETRARFASEAKTYIEEECSWPNIGTFQALGMMASYYSGQGQQTLGFMYFGMSVRVAQALGLSADCTPLLHTGRLRPQQVFERAWAFHMGCAQDACWSLYVGRECGISLPPSGSAPRNKDKGREDNGAGDTSIPRPGASSSIPMNDPFCLHALLADGTSERLDHEAWRGNADADMNMRVERCKTFTVFLWSCQLLKISRQIMDLMNILAKSDGGTEIKLIVTEIDIQLDKWRQDLPAELRVISSNESGAPPNKLMMHAAFWWQLILLHRPFYHRYRAKSTTSDFSVARCNTAAREILNILRLWRKLYGTVRFSPITLIQTIFASGTIYILQAMQAAMGRRPATQTQASALENVEELVGFLRECAESWECATRIADIFEKLLRDQRRTKADRINVPRKRVKKQRVLSRPRPSIIPGAIPGATATPSPVPTLVTHNAEDSASGETSPDFPTPSIPSATSQPIGNSPTTPFFLQYDPSHPIAPHTANSAMSDTGSPLSLHPQPFNALQNGYPFAFKGTNSLMYRSDYFSDDSYASDNQYMSTDDRDQPMYSSEGFGGIGASALDLGFLFDAESSLDAVMPGMSMFDPIGLGGMGLGSGPGACDVPAFNMPSFGFQLSGHANAAGGSTSGPGIGMANTFSGMDFMSDGEDTALYDILAALSNPGFNES